MKYEEWAGSNAGFLRRIYVTLRNVINEGILIGELCKLAECTPRTVRHYEAEGLVAPIGQTAGARKLYPRGAAEVIRMMAVLQLAGYSLRDVREMLKTTKSKSKKAGKLAHRLRDLLKEVLGEIEKRRAALDQAGAKVTALLEKTSRCDDCNPEDCGHCPNLGRLRTLGLLEEKA